MARIRKTVDVIIVDSEYRDRTIEEIRSYMQVLTQITKAMEAAESYDGPMLSPSGWVVDAIGTRYIALAVNNHLLGDALVCSIDGDEVTVTWLVDDSRPDAIASLTDGQYREQTNEDKFTIVFNINESHGVLTFG
jgi:hypothetical protein